MLPDRKLHEHLRAISRHTPTLDQTSRALDATRAALNRQTPRKPSPWLLRVAIPAALAAGLLAVAFLWFRHADNTRATSDLLTAAASAQSYSGWIHMTAVAQPLVSAPDIGEMRFVYHMNPREGIFAARRDFAGVSEYTFRSTTKHTFETYNANTPVLKRKILASGDADAIPTGLLVPATLSDAMTKAALARESGLLHKRDGELDQYDVTVDRPVAEHPPGGAFASTLPPKFSLWVDGRHQITRMKYATDEYHIDAAITYDTRPMPTIYDLGVPRDVRVLDDFPDRAESREGQRSEERQEVDRKTELPHVEEHKE